MASRWLALALIALGAFALRCEDAVRGRPEVTSDAAGAAGSEAAADSPDLDATEAAVEAESEPPITFCDTVVPVPYFCDDFEGPFKAIWDNSLRTPDLGEFGGGKLALDDTFAVSKPYSASMYTPAIVDTAQAAGATLIRTFHNPPVDMILRMTVRIDTEFLVDGGQKLIPFVTINFVNKGWIFLYRSNLGPGFSISSDATGPGAINLLTKPFPVGQPMNLDIVIKNHPIDDSAPDGDVLVRLNVLNAGESPLPADFQQSDSIKIIVGPVASGVIGEFQMNVDNVQLFDRSDL